MFGSQWGSCDVDGDYVFTTAEGAVIVAMSDPDYGDAFRFCLVVPGCTDAGPCNFAKMPMPTTAAGGDACDDGDESTVFDITADCECAGSYDWELGNDANH